MLLSLILSLTIDIWSALAITTIPSVWRSFPCKSSSCSPVLRDIMCAMSGAASLVHWLSLIPSLTKLELLPNPCNTLVMPVALRWFPFKISSCIWVLWDNKVAKLSADSLVMLLFIMINLRKVEVCCKARSTTLQSVDQRSLISSSSSCSWVLWDRMFAISSTALLLMLLFAMYNLVSTEVFCKLTAIAWIPLAWKRFPFMWSSFNCVLQSRTFAMSPAAWSQILLSLRQSLDKDESCLSDLQTITHPLDCRLLPCKSSSSSCTLCCIISAIKFAVMLFTVLFTNLNVFKLVKVAKPTEVQSRFLLRTNSCRWVFFLKNATI